jgi:hypothetical protein
MVELFELLKSEVRELVNALLVRAALSIVFLHFSEVLCEDFKP